MTDEVKHCKFCGGEIKATAMKCKHCGQFLNEDGAQANVSASGAGREEIKVNVKQVLNVSLVSLVISVIFALMGITIIFQGSIGIADITYYLTEWVMAIFFLLVWQFTK